eukprot:757876-Hanusia_phi.AAC.1
MKCIMRICRPTQAPGQEEGRAENVRFDTFLLSSSPQLFLAPLPLTSSPHLLSSPPPLLSLPPFPQSILNSIRSPFLPLLLVSAHGFCPQLIVLAGLSWRGNRAKAAISLPALPSMPPASEQRLEHLLVTGNARRTAASYRSFASARSNLTLRPPVTGFLPGVTQPGRSWTGQCIRVTDQVAGRRAARGPSGRPGPACQALGPIMMPLPGTVRCYYPSEAEPDPTRRTAGGVSP